MYKSNLYQQKEEIFKYSSSQVFNLLSPPYNPKLKSRPYINPNIATNLPKFRPLNLYSSCFSPFQSGKNLSVKNINSPDVKESQNILSKFSPYQKGTANSKIIGSPNTTNSDLLTSTSLTSQQSNESFLSNNANNNSIYIPTSFQPFNISRCNNYYSMINPKVNFYNNISISNNNVININNININNINGKAQHFEKYKINNVKEINNINNINNFNSDNSSKSSSDKSDKTDSDKSNKMKNGNKIGYNNNSLPPKKKYFNKFNASKENITNENTVILTLKIKVGKNDYRIFNLKKYDDLFISLEKFFDLNKIEQSLVKPIVNKIFAALNKIFWLLNNKIGNYDQKYLNSLYKLWIKNKETIPKRNKSKERSNNNSTISSSSESNDGNKKHKKILSNSFQDVNNLSEDDKDEKQKTAKSI